VRSRTPHWTPSGSAVNRVRVSPSDGISNADFGGAAGATEVTTAVGQHADPSSRRGDVVVIGHGWSESLSPVHHDQSRLDYHAEIGGGVGENADVVQGVAVDEDEVSMRAGLDHPDLA
jgi:hypothetical protein